MTDAVKATLDEFLNDDAKLSELVTETFPNAGGKALVKDIQPNLKQYIDQHDSGAVSEEKRDLPQRRRKGPRQGHPAQSQAIHRPARQRRSLGREEGRPANQVLRLPTGGGAGRGRLQAVPQGPPHRNQGGLVDPSPISQ